MSHKKTASDLLGHALALIDCALSQKPLLPDRHEAQFDLTLVPEVKALYEPLYWLYTSPIESKPFREPVNAVALGLLDYFNFVTSPMSLRCVLDRIASGDYSNASQVMQDVELIWANCKLYNGVDKPIWHQAQVCRNLLNERITNARESALATEEDQDKVAQYIEEVNSDAFNDKVLELLEAIEPGMVNDGELDLSRLTVRASRKLEALYASYMQGTLAGGKRQRDE